MATALERFVEKDMSKVSRQASFKANLTKEKKNKKQENSN